MGILPTWRSQRPPSFSIRSHTMLARRCKVKAVSLPLTYDQDPGSSARWGRMQARLT